MKPRNAILPTLTLLLCQPNASPSHSPNNTPSVSRCQDMVSTHSGMGPVYRGLVKNEDYGFSVYVPQGLTGWGGVAESAPFHGFTIFLDKQERSCIVFEIHIRVNEEDFSQVPTGATSVSLGMAQGWRIAKSGQLHNLQLINIETKFTFRQHDQIDDGEIVLVAPEGSANSAKASYEIFLQSLKFGKRD